MKSTQVWSLACPMTCRASQVIAPKQKHTNKKNPFFFQKMRGWRRGGAWRLYLGCLFSPPKTSSEACLSWPYMMCVIYYQSPSHSAYMWPEFHAFLDSTKAFRTILHNLPLASFPVRQGGICMFWLYFVLCSAGGWSPGPQRWDKSSTTGHIPGMKMCVFPLKVDLVYFFLQ